MTPNAPSLSDWQLYVIADQAAAGTRDLLDVVRLAILGGADVIQLRDKAATVRRLIDQAERLLPVTQAAGIPLIVNDRVDVALHVGADGVHLGQDDLPLGAARSVLGPNRLIGKSTHSIEQALAAEAEGADYIGVGPIFATPTKPDAASTGLSLIRQVAQRVRIPWVCIGGIDAANLLTVLTEGARRVAVVRAVCAADDPQAAADRLKRLLTQFLRSRKQGGL